MDDLEGEILALFGGNEREKDSQLRNKDSSKSEKKRRRGDPEYSDNEDTFSVEETSKSKTRSKSKNTNKSSHSRNRNEPSNSLDQDELVDEWGSDLMGDEEDRSRLNALPEVERERILAERQEQRDIMWERMELKKKLQEGLQSNSFRDSSKRDQSYNDSESYSRNRGRSSRSSVHLKELRRKRIEKSSKKPRNNSDSQSQDYSDEDNSDYNSRKTPLKERNPTTNRLAEDPIISLQELNSIRLSRDVLDKWIYTPLFNETVVGCYVRIRSANNMENFYIAEIAKVLEKSEPSYMLKRHYVDVRLRILANDSVLDVGIDSLSNNEFTIGEYEYLTEMLSNNTEKRMRVPTAKVLEKKRKSIEAKNNQVLTAKDIDHRVKMFQEIGKRKINKEIARLPVQNTGPQQSGPVFSSQAQQIGVSDTSRTQNINIGQTSNLSGSGLIGSKIGGISRLGRVSNIIGNLNSGSQSPLLGSIGKQKQLIGQLNINATLSPIPNVSSGTNIASLSSVNNPMSEFSKQQQQVFTKVKVTPGYEQAMSVPNFDLSFINMS
ncbi:hypothetical protein BB559_000709 [Furculomyces boomerangus]|uniref:Plus3 domain-containing protein n=2 Tax=Harpellales TaxID=61421 RepID=A0A2T9Z4D9_9FUNG|nr:hypothetical protein BB559_000709 [Furculomyces boomerangus]PWA02742.1 hypothetical protein BB558_001116 [Smittium angustum]